MLKRKQILGLVMIAVITGTVLFFSQKVLERQKIERSRASSADVLVTSGLKEKVTKDGKVSVLVKLNQVIAEEGSLSRDKRDLQRQQIKNSQDELEALLKNIPHKILRKYKTVPMLNLEVTPESLSRLQALKGIVAEVSEDIQHKPQLNDSRELVGTLIYEVAPIGLTGKDQVIAIIDIGFDFNHPFLKGKNLQEFCFADCPNGTDYQEGLGASVECQWTEPGVCSHGTAVAGIVAGNGNITDSTTGKIWQGGIAKEAKLITLRVSEKKDCAPGDENNYYCSVGFPTSLVLAAWDKIVEIKDQYNIVAVNKSGSPNLKFSEYCDSWIETPFIKNLSSLGIAVVTSTGNEGYFNAISPPSCVSTVIPVANIGKSDATITTDTNIASTVSFPNLLVAPGNGVVTSTTSSNGSHVWSSVGGTSSSAPHVAGAIAILKQAQPLATVDQMIQALKETAKLVEDSRGSLPLFPGPKYPLIQVDKAVSFLKELVTEKSDTSSGTDTSGTIIQWQHKR